MILWAIYFVPFFGNQLTMTFLLLDIAPILLIALPMTLVIITGEIDLSVASVVGLSSVLLGSLVDHGWAVPAAMLVALLAGLLCGLINGFLVAYVGLPSLAVTIGTLALFRGIAVGLLGTKAVTDFPQRWTDLAKAEIGGTGFPVIVVPFVVLARRLRPAAALLGVRPRRLRHRPQRRGGALHRRQRRAHQAACSSCSPASSRRSPASTSRCGSAALAATTPPGSSSR